MDNYESLDLFTYIRKKEILLILQGDKKFGEYTFCDGEKVDISMPYLTMNDLRKLGSKVEFLECSYDDCSLSRWQYLDMIVEFCIHNGKISFLLKKMFSKESFSKSLFNHSAKEINEAYEVITKNVLDIINGILFLENKELIYLGNNYIIRDLDVSVNVSHPLINGIDREYIKNMALRAMRDVDQQEFDSAITKARTLIEETFCYVIEQKGEIPSDSGDVNRLFKQVKQLYNMHTDKTADKRINTLLSGLNSIVSSIAEMRNEDSDSHGVGAKRISIKIYHARLLVNSAITLSEFVLSVCKNN